MIPAGNFERIDEIEFREVAEIPDVESRSLEVTQRIRKRPVEGKSVVVSIEIYIQMKITIPS